MEKAAVIPTDITPHLIEHSYSGELPNPAKWTLQGYSRAGERTGFFLSPINILLDSGVATNKTPVSIFLTHSHTDHSWNLPIVYGCRTPKIKGFENLTGRPVYAPKSAFPMIQQMELAIHNLSSGCMDETMTEDNILEAQGVAPFYVTTGDRFESPPGLADIVVDTFPCYHTCETIAFGFSKIKSKLKSEYQKLSGKEIGELRKKGVEINEKSLEPQLIFYGDTHIDALLNHGEWKVYPVIIIECTLFPNSQNKDEETARRIGHIHWNSILPIIKENPNNHFVLIHFSQSCKKSYLTELEENTKKNENIQNFKFWI